MVNIDKSPFLLDGVCLLADGDSTTLNISTLEHFKDSAVLNVDEVVLFILELLEPASIGVPELNVIASSSVGDVKRFVFVHDILDGL